MNKRQTKPRTPKPVSYRDVSTIAMVAGNEKKFTKIIHDRQIKQWVGIGWVSEEIAQPHHYLKYPEVK